MGMLSASASAISCLVPEAVSGSVCGMTTRLSSMGSDAKGRVYAALTPTRWLPAPPDPLGYVQSAAAATVTAVVAPSITRIHASLAGYVTAVIEGVEDEEECNNDGEVGGYDSGAKDYGDYDSGVKNGYRKDHVGVGRRETTMNVTQLTDIHSTKAYTTTSTSRFEASANFDNSTSNGGQFHPSNGYPGTQNKDTKDGVPTSLPKSLPTVRQGLPRRLVKAIARWCYQIYTQQQPNTFAVGVMATMVTVAMMGLGMVGAFLLLIEITTIAVAFVAVSIIIGLVALLGMFCVMLLFYNRIGAANNGVTKKSR